MQNAVKHAEASRITVTVDADASLVLAVSDDGGGYDAARADRTVLPGGARGCGDRARNTLSFVSNARPLTAADDAAVALERRRGRYLVLLSATGLAGESIGSWLVLLSGYCPIGRSCLASGSVGATLVGSGFLAVIGVGVLGSLLLASGLAFLGVGAGVLVAGLQGAGWVGLVIGGEFFAMGLILVGLQQWQAYRRRRTEREEAALWAVGSQGRAVVLDVDDADRRSGHGRIVTLVLRIDPGNGGERYDVQVEHLAGPGEQPQPGDLHLVRVDPDDRTHLVVGPKEEQPRPPGSTPGDSPGSTSGDSPGSTPVG